MSIDLKHRWLGFVIAYVAALAAMLLIYLAAERYYFQDGTTDFAVLSYVLPRAALVAVLPGIAGSLLSANRRVLQIICGVVGGPLAGWLAIKVVHVYGVLS